MKAPSSNVTNAGLTSFHCHLSCVIFENVNFYTTELFAFMQVLEVGMQKLVEGQQKHTQQLASLAAKINKHQEVVVQDDIADLVQEEVLCVYFDIAKVEQGEGNKLQLALIKRIEEKEKVKLLVQVKDYIRKKLVPVVLYSLSLFPLMIAIALTVHSLWWYF